MNNLDEFINVYVTKRSQSMFINDIENNRTILSDRIKNKTVLVIGGAGTIGSSFIKAVLPFQPAALVIVDINENALTELTRDLRSTNNLFIPEDYIPYPMDFNSRAFEKMFRARGGFHIVANFSAHKHVRSERDIYSIEVLFQNNVFHVKNLLDLLSEFPPEEYFCVSTDKAANPANIMGASKRIMEDLIFSYSDKFPVKTARFANVAFSNGSLPEGFLKRISKLQPLSAPSDIKRYFVSPEESGQICMLSCMIGYNREIFFPKLETSQMMAFDEIASKLLDEYGYDILYCKSDEEAIHMAENLKNGSIQYPVFYSKSNTPGEKSYEEFFTQSETIDMKRLQALGVIINQPFPDREKIDLLFDQLNTAFNQEIASKENIVQIIQSYLPNFHHIGGEKSLDHKM